MLYSVEVKIMPLKELLDPQGKAVMGGLGNLGLQDIKDVRVGKCITLQIESDSSENAIASAETAAKKLLANQVMEQFEVRVL
ncbi:MAG: phosphoribosylformylglycinamidine synthase subunit PurS [Bacteroidota bacterium]|jgi:phosphoribosylformylglycinamidine synthase PurS subunit